MARPSPNSGLLRKLLVAAVVLVVLVIFLLLFQFTDVAFRVWERLRATNGFFLTVYLLGVALIAGGGALLAWKIWTVGRPKRKKKPTAGAPGGSASAPHPAQMAALRQKVETAKAQGLDVAHIEADLASVVTPPLQLEVAFFGKISTGKSSLIKTLIPEAEVNLSIVGGSTSRFQRYEYRDENLDLVLLDMPGTQQVEALLGQEEEIVRMARRVHLIAYVLDQDMTQTDRDALDQLQALDKPLLLVLNKSSRYSAEELAQLRGRLRERLPTVPLVCTDSLHWQKRRKLKADGSQEWLEKLGGGDVSELLEALVRFSAQREQLSQKQRAALLHLAEENLTAAVHSFRRAKAEALVKSTAHKAMLGGVAAVGPGTDVIIQGYLGVNLFQALARIYDISVRDMDAQVLIDQATQKASTKWTLTLALAGNICKAFPGIGTVLGGASHALAYGLIFESLGKACIDALEAGAYDREHVLASFEQELGHDLENRAKILLKTFKP